MSFIHLVAHVRRGGPTLWEQHLAARLWRLLRAAFPDALAVTVMPDHVHVILLAADPHAAVLRLAHALGGFAWSRGPVWEPIPPPKVLPNTGKLRRDLRYAALNPCRRHLVRDPLEWPWSTHRDLMGCAADPWIRPARLAPLVGWRVEGFRASWHGYVSRDRDVDPAGTPAPQAATAREVPVASVGAIARAAASACRVPPAAVRRRGAPRDLFLALARHQGWRGGQELAACCAISPRASRRLPEVREEDLLAAATCLQDARLVRWLEHAGSIPQGA